MTGREWGLEVKKCLFCVSHTVFLDFYPLLLCLEEVGVLREKEEIGL